MECKKCGNTEKFIATLHYVVELDGEGNFIDDGSDQCPVPENHYCAECGESIRPVEVQEHHSIIIKAPNSEMIDDLMQAAGDAMKQLAKENGWWDAVDYSIDEVM